MGRHDLDCVQALWETPRRGRLFPPPTPRELAHRLDNMIDTVSTTYINKYVLLSLCLQGFPDTINYTVEKAQETVNCDKAF